MLAKGRKFGDSLPHCGSFCTHLVLHWAGAQVWSQALPGRQAACFWLLRTLLPFPPGGVGPHWGGLASNELSPRPDSTVTSGDFYGVIWDGHLLQAVLWRSRQAQPNLQVKEGPVNRATYSWESTFDANPQLSWWPMSSQVLLLAGLQHEHVATSLTASLAKASEDSRIPNTLALDSCFWVCFLYCPPVSWLALDHIAYVRPLLRGKPPHPDGFLVSLLPNMEMCACCLLSSLPFLSGWWTTNLQPNEWHNFLF